MAISPSHTPSGLIHSTPPNAYAATTAAAAADAADDDDPLAVRSTSATFIEFFVRIFETQSVL